MRKLLKLLMYPWEIRKKRKEELEKLLAVSGLKLVKRKNTSIVLGCLVTPQRDNGTFDVVNEVDNTIIYDTGLTYDDAAQKVAKYNLDAKKTYPKLSGNEALSRYMADKIKRIKIIVKNTEDIGKQGNRVIFKLVDNLGNEIGILVRSIGEKGRKVIYKFNNIDIDCYALVLNKNIASEYNLPIKHGENLFYVDFNIPKSITDEVSGLGKIMLDDALAFFKGSKKIKNIDGTIDLYIKSSNYDDYGGKSIILNQFWKAMEKNGGKIEESAFSTFAGSWAKDNKFTKLWYDPINYPITKEEVLFKFLKE